MLFVGTVTGCRRLYCITPLLTQLPWLKAPERIEFKLAVLIYRYLHRSAPPYLALRNSSSRLMSRRFSVCASLRRTSSLVVRRTRLSTIGDRTFPVAASRLWNTLPQNVTSASSPIVLQEASQDPYLQSFFPLNTL